MRILHLDSPLFPDRETVAAALANLQGEGHSLHRLDIPRAEDDAAWDEVAAAILDADTVIT